MEKFDSLYSPGKKIGPNQWLAEWITGRQAQSKGIQLPNLFWKTSKVWNKEYLRQLRAANGLIRIYSLPAISAALKSKQGKKVLSLQASWFDDLVQEEERKIQLVNIIQEDKVEEKKEEQSHLPIIRQEEFKGSKKSLKDKLDG